MAVKTNAKTFKSKTAKSETKSAETNEKTVFALNSPFK